ncbi:protein lin-28 homolog [Clavelina lepadiformis]|uniref:Uncharacterized protein n=1 Tax=Clavelina lepadiformis TaxID=159417 RepID=A0ABP0G7Y4_CLALP
MASESTNDESPNRSEKDNENGQSLPREDSGDVEGLCRRFGTCKWFNSAKGYGFVTPDRADDDDDEEKDIFVYQSVIQMSGFRSLGEGEKVTIWYKTSSLGLEAHKVCGADGGNCQGSERKPKRKKRPDRCFNCQEAGHHAKECHYPPLPKRCHHCKSVEHLVIDCPVKRDSSSRGESADSERSASSRAPEHSPVSTSAQ